MGRVEVAGVSLSHPDRELFPVARLTKQDLAEYYLRVADLMVPHVAGRPLTLVRCPTGAAGDCFFMRHSKVWAPAPLRRVHIQEKTKIGEYLIADTASALVALAQMDVMEIHTWNTRIDDVERPDRIIFDIDPGDQVEWREVVEVATLVRRALAALDLDCWPKTTGGRGLHVVVPLVPHADWNACLLFSRSLAGMLERTDPRLTTTFARAGRSRKLLIDYLRNNRTNTSIAAFSTRAKPGATVSVPVTWEELARIRDPARFTVPTVLARLRRRRRDPWGDYWTTRQRLTKTRLRAVAA